MDARPAVRVRPGPSRRSLRLMQQLGSAARSVRSLRLEGYCEITRSESLKTGGKAVA